MGHGQEVQEIEISIEEAKERIKIMNAILKLVDNDNYKTVFEEEYFGNECARLVLFRADPSQQTPALQEDINNAITAIGYLHVFLRAQVQMGRRAEMDLKADQETREEILMEDAVIV